MPLAPLGEDNWKHVPGLSWTLPRGPFFFTDLNLFNLASNPEVQITDWPFVIYLALHKLPYYLCLSCYIFKVGMSNTQLMELFKDEKQEIIMITTGSGICRYSINVSYHYYIISSGFIYGGFHRP